MNRHPLFTTRTSQVIKLVRAEAKEEGLQIFTWEFMKNVTEQKMTDDCIFSMDKTGFAQKNKTRKVIAVTGSKKLWSKSVEASFHTTIVDCVDANGFYVPPLFLILGQRFNRATMD